jgi:hypothetical protein
VHANYRGAFYTATDPRVKGIMVEKPKKIGPGEEKPGRNHPLCG